MAMTDIRRVKLDALLPVLNGKVAAVPRSIALSQLRLSVNELCQESKYWEEEIARITPDPDNRHGYEVVPPKGMLLAGAMQVTYTDSKELVDPDLYEFANPHTVVFDPAVNVSVSVVAAVKLGDSSDIPELLVNDFSEAIAAGAAKRLVLMPSRSWYAPELSAMFNEEYRAGKSQAQRDAQNRYESHFAPRRLNRSASYW